MRIPSHIAALELLGGHPVLDFVNTLSSWDHPAPRDALSCAGDVAGWMQRAGLVEPGVAHSFAGLPPGRAAMLLRAAHGLRGKLHGLFCAVAHGRPPGNRALAWLNAELVARARFRRLEQHGPSLAWTFVPRPATPSSLLAPLIFATADLLAGGQLGRIKECPPPDGCGWLFLDSSRNGRRTWCSMRTCGNLAKARRFRARRRH